MADSFVRGRPSRGEFWVGSYFCPAAEVQRRLEEYIVADEVEVAEPPPSGRGWLCSARAREPGPPPRPPRAPSPFQAAGRRARLGNCSAAGIRLGGDGPPVWARSPPGGRANWSASGSRRAFRPFPRDAGPADLPPEADLAAAAISYTKGCYTRPGGDRAAEDPRPGAPPPAPRARRRARAGRARASLVRGEESAGELRSAVGAAAPGEFLGLAMVTADFPADAALGFAADADPAAAAVRFCV